MTRPLLRDAGSYWRLPAFASAHSHCFQRAMRGQGQRMGENADDDFWSWRKAMYGLAESLTPESLGEIARHAFAEMYRAGIRTVGEFHYVHHQADGTPYGERTLLSEVVIEAALAEGLQICLLRTIYQRAGAGRPPEGAQNRFCDANLDDALADVDQLLRKYNGHEQVRIGVAAHSVRALSPEALRQVGAFALERDLPLHMHVAEQPQEVASCLAETGRRPVELVADLGMLSPRFVGVHITHLLPHEAKLLGDAQAFGCICATTERDLGDGHPHLGDLIEAGVRFCVGIDSHVTCEPFEEMRGVELGERLRCLKRITYRGGEETPAEWLWHGASVGGARSVGFADSGGELAIHKGHPELRYVEPEHTLDALVYSATKSVLGQTPLSSLRPAPQPFEAGEGESHAKGRSS